MARARSPLETTNPPYFREEFDRLAPNGVIGDPSGLPAFAYLRVSSEEQADEGRSGLPRQLQHIHERALADGYSIVWDRVFADDFTGFELERPRLNALRKQLRNPQRQADALIIEHLDRLSRHAYWHQGYLLDECASLGVTVRFWHSFNSRIEQAVMGAIAQEGMEESKKRQREGNLHKARTGRVTARSAAYGYRLVDENGQETSRARKNTHYGIDDQEAAVVQRIFEGVAAGKTLSAIGKELTDLGIRPPKQSQVWYPTQIRLLVRSEVYRGDYYAHRWYHTTRQVMAPDGLTSRTVKCKVEYPRDEWIHVSVPAIVSRELWHDANRMLDQNRATSIRNSRGRYLLTGLVECAECGKRVIGKTQRYGNRSRRRGKTYEPYTGYVCHNGAKSAALHLRAGITPCSQGMVNGRTLEAAVWRVVQEALLNPDRLIEALEMGSMDEQSRDLDAQYIYIQQQIDQKADEDERLFRAYLAAAFDEHEYAARRQMLKQEVAHLKIELKALQERIVTPDQLESRKSLIRALAARANNDYLTTIQKAAGDPETQQILRTILKMVVDRVLLNQREGWFILEGLISGQFAMIVNTPDRADSTAIPCTHAAARQS